MSLKRVSASKTVSGQCGFSLLILHISAGGEKINAGTHDSWEQCSLVGVTPTLPTILAKLFLREMVAGLLDPQID